MHKDPYSIASAPMYQISRAFALIIPFFFLFNCFLFVLEVWAQKAKEQKIFEGKGEQFDDSRKKRQVAKRWGGGRIKV